MDARHNCIADASHAAAGVCVSLNCGIRAQQGRGVLEESDDDQEAMSTLEKCTIVHQILKLFIYIDTSLL